jgi:isocitrate dehydrogenase
MRGWFRSIHSQRTGSRSNARPGHLHRTRPQRSHRGRRPWHPRMAKIIYTLTDEAPLLATYSFLPDRRGVTAEAAGVEVETRDISLAGRILAAFADRPARGPARGRRPRRARRAGQDARGQHHQAAQHLGLGPAAQGRHRRTAGAGLDLPDYPDDPQTDAERDAAPATTRSRAAPSTRSCARATPTAAAPASVKNYARKHPHSMGAWSSDSKTNVATWANDFRSNEKSSSCPPPTPDDQARRRRRHRHGPQGRPEGPRRRGRRRHLDVAGARRLPRRAGRPAKADGVLFSVHLKATMMKVSDPIIFGHVVRAFFADDFRGVRRDVAGRRSRRPTTASPRSSPGSTLPNGAEIKAAFDAGAWPTARAGDGQLRQGHHQPARPQRRHRRRLDAGHDPHLGHMWGPDGKRGRHPRGHPRQFYAGVYQAVIDDCKAHGAYDPTTMGSVPNVGLMAQKAEEYGSHDKTFEIAADGTVQVVNGGRRGADGARGRGRRHLARLPDQGRPDPGLGQARRHPRPRHRHPASSGSTRAAPTTPT